MERWIPTIVAPIEEFGRIKGLLSSLVPRELRMAFSAYRIFVPIAWGALDRAKNYANRYGWHIINFLIDKFPKKTTPLSLKNLEKKIGKIPKSINVIGDIVVVNIFPEELNIPPNDKRWIIIRENFGARAIFIKKAPLHGEHRTTKWLRVNGWGDTFTLHSENGINLAVDLDKAFFNPRLGGERLRILKKTRPRETIIDMFAGVGSFAILLAKRRKAKVYAIDINPWAVRLMHINKTINKVDIDILEGDARNAIHEIPEKADRIIMNYPEHAYEFLDDALVHLKPGGIIHLYVFGSTEQDALSRISEKLNSSHLKIEEIVQVSEVAPYRYLYCLDLKSSTKSD